MRILRLTLLLAVVVSTAMAASAGTTTVLGWNNLGMHCMDSDYSVFSVLPPTTQLNASLSLVAGWSPMAPATA